MRDPSTGRKDSPILKAAERHYIGCLKLLVRFYKDAQRSRFWTPSDQAVAQKEGEIIQALFQTDDFQGDEVDCLGRTPLLYAMMVNHSAADASALSTLLLKLGRDVTSLADDSGASPLSIAEDRAKQMPSWERVVEILKKDSWKENLETKCEEDSGGGYIWRTVSDGSDIGVGKIDTATLGISHR